MFHTPEWLQVLSGTYRFTPVAYASVKHGAITGVVPFCLTRGITGDKRLVSLPYSDFCEPLGMCENDIANVVALAKNELNGHGYVELRGGGHLPAGTTIWNTMLTHDIDCSPSKDALFKTLRESLQRNIRKAERSNLTCSFATSIDSVQQFYHLNCLTRREHGLPPQPWKFFEHIWRLIVGAGNGFIATVLHEGVAVAAALFLRKDGKVWYKFGASTKNKLYLRPNDFILWRSLLHCKAEGASVLNLGRTELQHSGLLRFKRGWGSGESAVNYYRYNCTSSSYISAKRFAYDTLCQSVISRMPLVFLKPVGSFIHQFAG